MDKIVDLQFGSKLYGTFLEGADEDYKGVFFPDERDILLGRIPRSINNKNDNIDSEYYSLHYFLKLALEGQTVYNYLTCS